ncbi:MAG TPA: hypothetical protein VM165_08655 [Planctomycetaceae bacterium]|nr:hypothetical protein [Planctomycetaceae bacterium]
MPKGRYRRGLDLARVAYVHMLRRERSVIRCHCNVIIVFACVTCLASTGFAAAGPARGNGKGAQKEKAGKPHKADKAQAKQNDKDDKQEAKEDRKDERDRDARDLDNRNMRFRGLDKNNDGVISRVEWAGNDNSFANHDWNRDGILSGNEVRPGAVQSGRATAGQRDNGRTRDRFADWDRNRDGRMTREEWRGVAAEFARLDSNRDGVLSPAEYARGQ